MQLGRLHFAFLCPDVDAIIVERPRLRPRWYAYAPPSLSPQSRQATEPVLDSLR